MSAKHICQFNYVHRIVHNTPRDAPIIIMPIDLYYHPASAPCRAVQLTAKAVGVQLNQHFVDLFAGANLAADFVALNPQHTVPTLVDNGLVLTESRAICVYLVERYGKSDDPLYPRDLQVRATINQRLYFDQGTLYASLLDLWSERLFRGGRTADAARAERVEQALALFDTYLKDSTYAAGEQFTVADIVLVASVSSYVHEHGVQLDAQRHANVRRWFARCKQVTPRYDVNVEGLRAFKQLFAAVKAR